MDTQLSSIGDRFSRFVVSSPVLSMGLGLLISVGFWSGFPNVTSNFTHTAFFYEDDPRLDRFNRFERQFGNDDAVMVVVYSPSGIFDVESAVLLHQLTADMWKIPEVIQVESISNFSWVHANGDDILVEPLFPEEELDIYTSLLNDESADRAAVADVKAKLATMLVERRRIALEHELLPDYLVDRRAELGVINARLKPGIDAPPDARLITAETRKLLDTYGGGDHEFHVLGGPVLNYGFEESSTGDMSKLLPIVLFMVVVFLALSLRALNGVVLPMLVIALCVTATVALNGVLGMELNPVTTMLPQILIAIAVADSVHILTSFYRARRRGKEKKAAAHYALTKNFVPTLLTSLSTAIGFFAFVSANLKPTSQLGAVAGVGTLSAWGVTYLILGSLLSVLPSLVRGGDDEERLGLPSPFALRFTDRLFRLRYAIVGVYVVVCGIGVWLAAQISINSDPYQYFREGYPLRESQEFVFQRLGGVPNFEFMIDSGKEGGIKEPSFLAKVEAFERKVTTELDGVNRSVSIVDILRQINRSLNGGDDRFYKLPDTREAIAQEKFLYEMSLPQGRDINNQVTVKEDAVRVSFVSTITDSATFTAYGRRIEEIAQEFGFNAKVTGKQSLYQSMNAYVVEAFVESLLIAVALISVLLFAFFRSFRTGSIALLPNVIPLLIGGAVLQGLGVYLDIGTVLVASVCLGIAVDDTIHIMANFEGFRREGQSVRQSIAMVITHTGPALATTTFVLVFGFGTLAFGTFSPTIYFGVMTAVVLTAALVTDLTFLPALLMIFSREGTQRAETRDAAALAS